MSDKGEVQKKRTARFKCYETVEKISASTAYECVEKEPTRRNISSLTCAIKGVSRSRTVLSLIVLSGLLAVSNCPVLTRAELRVNHKSETDRAASHQQLNALQRCFSLRRSFSIAT